MDPLSMASTIIGVISVAHNILGVLRREGSQWDRLDNILQPDLRRFETATVLLKTIGTNLPTNDVIPGVDLCLQICVDSQEEVQMMLRNVLGRSGSIAKRLLAAGSIHFLKEKLPGAVDQFVGAVELLRSLSQEARSMSMSMAIRELDNQTKFGLERQTQSMREMGEQARTLVDQMRTVMELFGTQAGNSRDTNTDLIHRRVANDDNPQIGEQLSQIKSRLEEIHRNSDERQKDMEKIWAQMQSSFAQQGPLEFNLSGVFVYTISILGLEEDEQGTSSSTHCPATLDSACDGNWVATWIVARAGLQGSITTVQDSDVFQSFSGHEMKPEGQIELTFFMDIATKSSQNMRTESFYVFARLPVELVLGKEFLKKNNHFQPNQPKRVLGLLKQKKRTPEEKVADETSTRAHKEANAEIIANRRKLAASGRDLKRTRKAGPGATTSGTNTPNSGSLELSKQLITYASPSARALPGSQSLVSLNYGIQSTETGRSEDSDLGYDWAQEPGVEAGPSRGS